MNLRPCFTHVSSTLVDSFILSVDEYLVRKYGYRTAENDIAPLLWYIRTGRASVNFLGCLTSREAYLIAKRLHEGGSYDEVIDRIKKYLTETTLYDPNI